MPQLPPTSVSVMNCNWRLPYNAPLGVPVVPDVKMIATVAVGIVVERRRRAVRKTQGRQQVGRATSAVITSTTSWTPS